MSRRDRQPRDPVQLLLIALVASIIVLLLCGGFLTLYSTAMAEFDRGR